jgi:hypothetical protein
MNIQRFGLALMALFFGVCSLDTVPKGSTMSVTTPPPTAMLYDVIDRFSIAAAWDGSPLVLQPNQNANMLQTTNGSMALAYLNLSTMNNQGTLSVVSGGNQPTFLPVPALNNQPGVLINNWKGNNLSVTNISVPGSSTPIQIQAIGPGLPGINPLLLAVGTLNLKPGQMAQGNALPQFMQIVFQSNSGQQAIFVLIGGPPDRSGNNAYMLAVNARQDAGPGTSNPTTPPPEGYYATTTSNYYNYQFNWGSSTIFVANMSGTTSSASQITLRQL